MKLANNALTTLTDKFAPIENMTCLTVATLVDPSYKQTGFINSCNADAAVERRIRECASIILPPAAAAAASQYPCQEDNLWGLLDSHVGAEIVFNATTSAVSEVQTYSNFNICVIFLL